MKDSLPMQIHSKQDYGMIKMDYERVDMREMSPEELELGIKQSQLVFKLNHTMPRQKSIMRS